MKYQHCVLLPFALILIGAGLVTLLYFGVRNLEPYTHTKDFRTATCIVTYSNISQPVTCSHQDSADPDKVIHNSIYPCLSILVNYTEEKIQLDPYGYEVLEEPTLLDPKQNDTEEEAYDIMTPTPGPAPTKNYVTEQEVFLYDGYSSWTMERKGGSNSTCSVHVCNEKFQDNANQVESVQEEFGAVGTHFKCFFNPRNHKEVFAEVVSGNSVLHALVWPALAMGFGLFLLVVVAFLSCEVWICRNPKRAQRRMQGQTYELASYRENLRESQQRGWRGSPREERHSERNSKRQPRPGDGNNNSRLPRLSAAADIVRKWSFRGRRDQSDTNRTSRSFGGVPSRQWSIAKADTQFCTT